MRAALDAGYQIVIATARWYRMAEEVGTLFGRRGPATPTPTSTSCTPTLHASRTALDHPASINSTTATSTGSTGSSTP